MAARSFGQRLRARGFRNVVLWPRGVDTSQFHPRIATSACRVRSSLCRARGGRKKSRGVLDLDLPGTKQLSATDGARGAGRKYPQAVFLARGRVNIGEAMPPPTSLCSRADRTPLAWFCWKPSPAACRLPRSREPRAT